MKQPFEHGDRSPTRGGLLVKHVLFLKTYGCQLVEYQKDSYGTFGAVLKSFDGLYFMFTSRGIQPWNPPMKDAQPHVSFQKRLFEEWSGIHVLGIDPNDVAPTCHVFHPELIRNHITNFKAKGYSPYNDYKGESGAKCTFVNFPLSLGEIWKPSEPLVPVWAKLKKRYETLRAGWICSYEGGRGLP